MRSEELLGDVADVRVLLVRGGELALIRLRQLQDDVDDRGPASAEDTLVRRSERRAGEEPASDREVIVVELTQQLGESIRLRERAGGRAHSLRRLGEASERCRHGFHVRY